MNYFIAYVNNNVISGMVAHNEYINATNTTDCINKFYEKHNKEYSAITNIIPLEDNKNK